MSEKSDFTSKVPKLTFSTILDQQIEQLKIDLLTQRFAQSRQQLSADPYRPDYHYVNPEGRLNDSNGLCYWQGRYHLFYQAYPLEDTRQHWGHAVSDDLVHWEDLPLAIYPGIENCCFSGSTLVEEDRVIAMYHGTSAGSMIAISNDPLLLNWEKISGCPVIPEKRMRMEDLTAFMIPAFGRKMVNYSSYRFLLTKAWLKFLLTIGNAWHYACIRNVRIVQRSQFVSKVVMLY